ncbi:MAG: electron transfer flavoprotein subunit alpha/FixB family protein [Desulfobacteraceae bacterium]|jgi:electron transfer flavoprotein alpha subunit
MSQNVLVIAEYAQEGFRNITYEGLSAGKRLAMELSGEMIVALLGSGVTEAAAELGSYGADRIIVADDAALSPYITETHACVLADIIAETAPKVVIIGATAQGKDLSARLSARLDAPLAMDCLALRIEEQNLVATRSMYGGKIKADVTLNGTPQMAAIRPKAMSIENATGNGTVESFAVNVDPPVVKVIGQQLETGKTELTEADVVVTGGKGMGSEDFTIIEDLASLLNGAVGASRSAVDEGWRPATDQVGQTGKVVSPNLYIASGVSGAIQHLAGMSSSKIIVAINKDPEAPIFQKADYGIVGDLFEVVPVLTKEIHRLKNT